MKLRVFFAALFLLIFSTSSFSFTNSYNQKKIEKEVRIGTHVSHVPFRFGKPDYEYTQQSGSRLYKYLRYDDGKSYVTIKVFNGKVVDVYSGKIQTGSKQKSYVTKSDSIIRYRSQKSPEQLHIPQVKSYRKATQQNTHRQKQYDNERKVYEGEKRAYEKRKQEIERYNSEVKRYNSKLKRKRYNAQRRKAARKYYDRGKSPMRDGPKPYLEGGGKPYLEKGYPEMMENRRK